jgi:hypothetical protein
MCLFRPLLVSRVVASIPHFQMSRVDQVWSGLSGFHIVTSAWVRVASRPDGQHVAEVAVLVWDGYWEQPRLNAGLLVFIVLVAYRVSCIEKVLFEKHS